MVTFAGFALSIIGWFLWNLALSGAYTEQYGTYLVHGAFIHDFGAQPVWWLTVIIALGGLTVMELTVQAVRRVYWPTDEDMMQRIEKDTYAKAKLADQVTAVESGQTETLEMQDVVAAAIPSKSEGHLKREGGL